MDVVWGAQSALSAWNNLHDLVLLRWDQLWEWSPWNCILLTKDEAAAHLKVDNVDKVSSHALATHLDTRLTHTPRHTPYPPTHLRHTPRHKWPYTLPAEGRVTV